MTNEGITFRKSSYSNQVGNCVEVGALPDGGLAVRDSKDPEGGVLTFAPGEFTAFVRSVARGEFDVR
jgi:hypothetical protein